MQTQKIGKLSRFITIFVLLLAAVSSTFGTVNSQIISAQEAWTPTPSMPKKTQLAPEIVGGNPADPGEWSWQVALINSAATTNFGGDNLRCGGSLVSPLWVV